MSTTDINSTFCSFSNSAYFSNLAQQNRKNTSSSGSSAPMRTTTSSSSSNTSSSRSTTSQSYYVPQVYNCHYGNSELRNS